MLHRILPALIAVAPLLAQSPIPDSPAGQKLKAWIENYNSGDAARIERYAQEHYAPAFLKDFPAKICAQMDVGAHAQTGEMFIHSVQPKGAHNLEILLANKDQSFWLQVSLGVAPEQPHRINLIGLRPGRKPTESQSEAKSQNLVSQPLPDTIAGKRLKSWLAAFNSGDAAKCAQFARESFSPRQLEKVPAEKSGSDDAGLHTQIGDLSVHSSESVSEFEVKATFVNKDQTLWLTGVLKVAAEPPHYLTALGLRPTERLASMKIERLADAPLAQAVDQFLQKRAAEDAFAGAVLIAKDGKPFFVKAYGMANREKKLPNTIDTKFALGSMNKMMTAVAIAQLAQAGKLRYEDTIAKLLPDYPNKAAAAKITVHHLLTHTSGLGDVFTDEWEKKKDSVRTIQDWFPFFVNAPLAFEPGAKHVYSNAGFVVLGAILEKVSGQDYYRYVREHIYRPLGMVDSDSYAKTDVVPNMAVGYMRGEKPGDPKRDNASTRPFRGFPAGGGYSTAGDLLKFAEGLRNNKLLSREHTDRLITKKVDIDPGFPGGYAYGFMDVRKEGLRTIGHNGGAPGMSAVLNVYWDSGYTAVVLANIDPPAVDAVEQYIRDRIQAK